MIEPIVNPFISVSMDLSNLWIFLLFLIPFLYLCLLHNLKLRNKNGVGNVRLPPGTSGLPFLGETLSFYLKYRRGVPLEFISDRMRKYSTKIFRTSLVGQQVAVISSAEGNKFMFSNDTKLVEIWFPSRFEKIFPKSDNQHPSVHGKRLRNLILPYVLRINGLQDCVVRMDAMMKQHLEAYWTCKSDHDIIKGSEIAKTYALAFACNLFLGINDLREIEIFSKGINEIEAAFIALPLNLPGTTWNRGIKASRFLRSRIEAMIWEKKMQINAENANVTDQKDFILDMISAKDENDRLMSVEDMASHLVGLLEVGYLNIQTTVSMLIKCLAELPHVYDAVLREQMAIASLKQPGEGIKWEDFEKMKYSWNVIREVLRLYSPGVGFKEAMVDLSYEGYTIPKGWKIYWLSQHTHMNPKYFPDPEKFDPSRFDGVGPIPYTFVPFGAGLRMCPGYKFGKLALLTFLHYVVTKFRWEKVNPDEKLLYDFVTSPAEGLPIRLYRHRN